jgi:hypothetical protein
MLFPPPPSVYGVVSEMNIIKFANKFVKFMGVVTAPWPALSCSGTESAVPP